MLTSFRHVGIKETLKALRGDQSALQIIAGEFVKRYPEYVAELTSSFRKNDRIGLEKRLHRLRGALGIFHAQPALELTISLEKQLREGGSFKHEEISCLINEILGVGMELSFYLDQPEKIILDEVS